MIDCELSSPFSKPSASFKLLDHSLKHQASTFTCGGFLFFWVLMQEKNNKKENLKMGRRKRHQSWGKRQIELTGRAPVRATKKAGARAMPSQRAKMDGDILRRDDVVLLYWDFLPLSQNRGREISGFQFPFLSDARRVRQATLHPALGWASCGRDKNYPR